MYSDETLERFKDIKNMGKIPEADAVGEVGNVYCGDIMRLYLKIENNVIIDAKFKTFGCVAAILSTDVACDLIIGKSPDEALRVTNQDVLDLMGDQIPKQKVHCSLMAQEAIAAAVKDFQKA